MAATIFTIAMNPEVSTIDNTPNVSDDLKGVFVQALTNFIGSPFESNGLLEPLESFYIEQLGDDVSVLITNQDLFIQRQNTKVVQMDMDAGIITSTSQAFFHETKAQAVDSLGSAEKISETEVLIADTQNNRAIIVDTATNRIMWEYNSDRYIVDAHIVLADTNILVTSSEATNSDMAINKNKTVIWTNNTNHIVTIYSGDIGDITDSVDIDLDLYGDDFKSFAMNPSDRFAYKFTIEKKYKWFSYPDLVKGDITISRIKAFSSDYFVILERDNLESPFTSRAIKIDIYGNIITEFGREGYLVKPSDARPLNNGILIST